MATLTTTDLAALRKADRVYFRSTWDVDQTATAHIACVREAKKTPANPWAEDQEYRVACNTTVRTFHGWTEAHQNCEFVPRSAGEHNGAAQYCPEWQTAVSMMRAGDELRLDWSHNGGSEEQERAGFCTDSLTLIIDRPARGKAKARRFAFLLARHSTRNFPYVKGSWVPREVGEVCAA